jgi:hypothetical protein
MSKSTLTKTAKFAADLKKGRRLSASQIKARGILNPSATVWYLRDKGMKIRMSEGKYQLA